MSGKCPVFAPQARRGGCAVVEWSRLADRESVWLVPRAAEVVGLEPAEFLRRLARELGLRPIVVAESPGLGPLVFGEFIRRAVAEGRPAQVSFTK